MYFYGTLSPWSYWIFYCLILSNKRAFCSCAYLAFWFSISFCFFYNSPLSTLPTICFLSSKACFFNNSFLSCSSFSSSSLISFCLRMADSNSAFYARACYSSILSFYICCSILAYFNSEAFFDLISAYCLSFSRAPLSFASIALLALKASSSACLSEAFYCNYLSLWISFYFSSLIRLNIKKINTFVLQQDQLIFVPYLSNKKQSFHLLIFLFAFFVQW